MVGAGGTNKTATLHYVKVWEKLALTPNEFCQNLVLGLNLTVDNRTDQYQPYEGDRISIDDYNNIILKTDKEFLDNDLFLEVALNNELAEFKKPLYVPLNV